MLKQSANYVLLHVFYLIRIHLQVNKYFLVLFHQDSQGRRPAPIPCPCAFLHRGGESPPQGGAYLGGSSHQSLLGRGTLPLSPAFAGESKMLGHWGLVNWMVISYLGEVWGGVVVKYKL